MRKLILKTQFSLGDVVMMTAAVRDLHRCYPNRFQTDVRTHFPEVWENNPYITSLWENDPEVKIIDCHYPLIDYANSRPFHCLQGYIYFLNKRLGLQIELTEFRGDIHLAKEEKAWASQVHELTGGDIPFWIVSAGGKHDITIKWWNTARYQSVIDHFQGRIAFVQIGESGDHHPKLNNAIDLRGKTNVRELIRLVYHAQGCLCPVTALMHLAPTIGTKPSSPSRRACVVVAGGREPPNWEAYPQHQFLHTVGSLPCCREGGCWKSRVLPLHDRDDRDKPENLCSNVIGGLPHCMHLITAEEVIRKIETYFMGGALKYLSSQQARLARRGVSASQKNLYDNDSLSRYNAPSVIQRVIHRIPAYPGGFAGRGIVICGGGLKYFHCAWVCIKMLRQLGCQLPIQLWHQGVEEMDAKMTGLCKTLGVECINAQVVEKEHPRRTAGGWELKAYAMLHSPFREVLFLDADNVPLRDPGFLFEEPAYKETGALFWPDYGRLSHKREIWRVCDVPYQKESEFESGQMLVDKQKCWRSLNLAFWMNDHADFFYNYIHGDKDTFHLAWRKLNEPYTMIQTPIESLDGVMCQHDLGGNRLFQHRNSRKWRLFGSNPRVEGFLHEDLCLEFLQELKSKWNGKIQLKLNKAGPNGKFIFRAGTCDRAVFQDIVEKNQYELPAKFSSHDVVIDVGAHIGSFSYACVKRGAKRIVAFEPESQNFKIAHYHLRQFNFVRLKRKAVWRSDLWGTTLVHSGYPSDDHEVNTGGGHVLVDKTTAPKQWRAEKVPTIALDRILEQFKTVKLLKLDCEGSEWPILFTSKLLHKVQKICGEYHELEGIPGTASVPGYARFTRKELEAFLRQRYKKVQIRPHVTGKIGMFWAQ